MTTISFIRPTSSDKATSRMSKVAMTEFDLCMWLGDAMPGDTLVRPGQRGTAHAADDGSRYGQGTEHGARW